MNTRRTSLKLTRMSVLSLVVALVLAALLVYQTRLKRFFGGTSIGLAGTTRAFVNLGEFSAERRPILDTSGLNTVGSHVPAWKPLASLDEIRDIWTGAAPKGVNEIDALLSNRPVSDTRRISLLITKAAVLNFIGDAEEAYTVLTDLRLFLGDRERLAHPHLASVIYFQGVTALRRGENDNCVMCRGESACIIPISPAAVHSNPTGSRLAITHFTEYLARFPDDLEIRWLLNLAHMTLGEYPDGVDPRYRSRPESLSSSRKLDIGRFHEIGERSRPEPL